MTTKQCRHGKCVKPATHHLVLRVKPKGREQDVKLTLPGIGLCMTHSAALKMPAHLLEHSRIALIDHCALRELPPPDFSTLHYSVEWGPPHNGRARVFAKPPHPKEARP